MVRRALLWYNQIPYMPGGWHTNWKIIILQRFSHRSKSSESHIRFPQPWGLALGGGAPRAFGFEGQWGLSTGAPQDWRKHRLHSWRVHTRFHVHWDPGQSSDTIGAWARPTCESWRVSWGGKCCLWFTVGARTLVAEAPRNVHQHELSQRSTFWHWDLAQHSILQAPVLGRLRPNNQQGGNRAPPISRQAG